MLRFSYRRGTFVERERRGFGNSPGQELRRPALNGQWEQVTRRTSRLASPCSVCWVRPAWGSQFKWYCDTWVGQRLGGDSGHSWKSPREWYLHRYIHMQKVLNCILKVCIVLYANDSSKYPLYLEHRKRGTSPCPSFRWQNPLGFSGPHTEQAGKSGRGDVISN